MKTGILIINNEKIDILFIKYPILNGYPSVWNFFYFYVKNDLELYSYNDKKYIENEIVVNNIALFDLEDFYLDVYIKSGIITKKNSDRKDYNRYKLEINNGKYENRVNRPYYYKENIKGILMPTELLLK